MEGVNMSGYIDRPANKLSEDEFGIEQYIKGLSDFILECDTPMTVAIQGDWGSGKTSMMNMIRETLGDKVLTTWFNTWQYSQFNMGDALAISFLSRLISDLGVEKANNDAAKTLVKTIGKQVALFTLGSINPLVGRIAEKVVESSSNSKEAAKEVDMPSAINELKKEFQNLVNEKITAAKKGRLVIFIDDLDRLHPGKAVELLEVLKLFLDCDKCVFVLAIDYAVVSQGVKQKYGELIGEEKGRSFFDKIIQVPFKMPVAKYEVGKYVAKSLRAIGVSVADEEIDTYVKLIQASVGCNPRAMKRLFNAFWLLNKVSMNTKETREKERKILFAVLCLQLSFEKVYNYIVNNPETCVDGTLLKALSDMSSFADMGKEPDKLSVELKSSTEADMIKLVDFMTAFVDVLDENGDGELSESEMQEFIRILGFTTVTATTVVERVPIGQLEGTWRSQNRSIAKVLMARLNSLTNYSFKIYQSQGDSADWKKYYVSTYTRMPCRFASGNIAIDFTIRTNLKPKDKVSELRIVVWYESGNDRYKFMEALKPWCEAQEFGFEMNVEKAEFVLRGKIVNAGDGETIINYFVDNGVKVIKSIERYNK